MTDNGRREKWRKVEEVDKQKGFIKACQTEGEAQQETKKRGKEKR